jgi:hypothetical protein
MSVAPGIGGGAAGKVVGMDQRHVWRGVGIATGLVAGLATRWLLVKVWTRVEGDEPPGNPAAPGTTWPAAITWALASGAALAIARLVAQRGAAEAWKTATGSYPEGLEESRA